MRIAADRFRRESTPATVTLGFFGKGMKGSALGGHGFLPVGLVQRSLDQWAFAFGDPVSFHPNCTTLGDASSFTPHHWAQRHSPDPEPSSGLDCGSQTPVWVPLECGVQGLLWGPDFRGPAGGPGTWPGLCIFDWCPQGPHEWSVAVLCKTLGWVSPKWLVLQQEGMWNFAERHVEVAQGWRGKDDHRWGF